MLKTRASRQTWLFVVMALLVLGAGLGLRDPWPSDEPRFALVAKQMVDSGDWLFPHRGLELYSDKPPMLMWWQATLYSVPTPIQRADQILLVEDALETGRSLRHALSVLASQAGSVRTAAYFYRPDAVIVPDYCVGPAAQIPAFPWEGH